MVTLQEVQFMPPIYLDHAATTPLDRRVREAMEPYLTDVFGNPSSIHRQGQQARMAVDGSRETVAWMLGAAATEIVFTGGGTEADNAAIYGVAWANRDRGRHIVTSAIEHEAVLEASAYLESQHDFEVSRVMPGSEGIVSVADIEAALRPDTVLVSVMYANNEIGTIQPVGDIGLLCRSRGVLFHVDAVQAVGTIPVDVGRDTIDLLSLSAHKFYGPKGVGALYVRSGIHWWPSQLGGGQERRRRSGTENVAGIVGMAKALSLACESMDETSTRIVELRNHLIEAACSAVPEIGLNGDPDRRLPGNANLRFPGVQGESMVTALDTLGIMVSTGSACASGSVEPSHVLRALGDSNAEARSAVRVTIGRQNTREEVDSAVRSIVEVYRRLRDSGVARPGMLQPVAASR
ncbi:MAG TPA: cysteine desulfurase family protein [Chloroflexota bacterium]|nr:cysteine desulfurase family protein [Chloroflexota bacterium]